MLSLALEIYRVYTPPTPQPPHTGTTHKRLIPDLSVRLFAEVSLLSARGLEGGAGSC